MATGQPLQQLKQTLEKLNTVDTEKLLRKTLGEESIEEAFSPYLGEIKHLKEFVNQYAPDIHDDFVRQAQNTLNTIADAMVLQAARPSAEYIAQRKSFLDSIKAQLEESKRWFPYFVAAAVVERGFLEDEGIRREYKKAVHDLKSQTASTLASVKEEAEKAVQGAKTLAEEIEKSARRTATRISVEEAQKQFNMASSDLSQKVRMWAWLTIGSIAILLIVPFAFMLWPLPEPDSWPIAIYHTILRIFVLSAAGATTTFCFRILRAHLHMAEKNRHRVRVANSVESFVNSALESQQRDLILAKLTEAIVDFGDSGIIHGERDEQAPGVISSDLLGRIVAAISPKRS